MSFFKFLQGIADKLGILESVPARESAPVSRIQTRTVSLQELAGEIRSGEVLALANSPSELSIPFEEIFAAAGISSKPEDWTIGRLGQLIAAETSRDPSRDSVQKAVLESLQTNGISAEIVIKDAIARDQALDAFENRVDEKMRDRSRACTKRLLEIKSQISDLQAEAARIEAAIKSEDDQWSRWRRLKRQHEREMATSVSFVVDHPVVTTDEV